MRVFVRVAQREGFAAAARDLGMSPAAVTKHVNALEQRLGTRLFDRTTRSVGLTEAGRVYLERCLEALQCFEDADASVAELSEEPRGLVRMTAPIDFGPILAPILGQVMIEHPRIEVDLRSTDRVVDLVDERIDLGIRVATTLDGSYVARPLARTGIAVYGAPSYFERFGRPKSPEDLAHHRCLALNEPRLRDEWVFERDGTQGRVKLNLVMVGNAGTPLLHAAVAGVGLAPMPSFLAYAEHRAGRIEPVLTEWKAPSLGVFAVYPHRRYLSPKVRVLVEALRAELGDGSSDPWWIESSSSTAGSDD